jgi:hypothetical protein
MHLKYNAENILTIGSITLRPGSNLNVSEEEFNKFRGVASIKSKLQSGVIQEIKPVLTSEQKAENKKEAASELLSDFSKDEAKKLVADCYDLEKLEEYEASEGRVTVLKAIRKQIDLINKEAGE